MRDHDYHQENCLGLHVSKEVTMNYDQLDPFNEYVGNLFIRINHNIFSNYTNYGKLIFQ